MDHLEPSASDPRMYRTVRPPQQMILLSNAKHQATSRKRWATKDQLYISINKLYDFVPGCRAICLPKQTRIHQIRLNLLVQINVTSVENT